MIKRINTQLIFIAILSLSLFLQLTSYHNYKKSTSATQQQIQNLQTQLTQSKAKSIKLQQQINKIERKLRPDSFSFVDSIN